MIAVAIKKLSPDASQPADHAVLAEAAGLEVHAGHGLGYDTVGPIAAIPQIVELNIGHFLIGAAIFSGLEGAIAEMRRLMEAARQPDRKA